MLFRDLLLNLREIEISQVVLRHSVLITVNAKISLSQMLGLEGLRSIFVIGLFMTHARLALREVLLVSE